MLRPTPQEVPTFHLEASSLRPGTAAARSALWPCHFAPSAVSGHAAVLLKLVLGSWLLAESLAHCRGPEGVNEGMS